MSAAPMQIAPEYRAAGTDLSERRRSGISRGPLIDIAGKADAAIQMTFQRSSKSNSGSI